MVEAITFYTLSAFILGLAILVVTVRNTLYSALLLAADFLLVALLYASMNNLLLAVIQVMVYAAGIVLVYVFVVILVNLKRPPEQHPDTGKYRLVGGILVAAGLAGLTPGGLLGALPPSPATTTEGVGSVENIAMALFTNYLIPFELASMLLLVAMVGAIVLAKKEL